MPLRAFVAGLFFSFMFSIPPSLKEPDFFTCSTATPMNASTPAFTATLRAFMAFFMAFMAFIAFIAFIAAMLRGSGVAGEMHRNKSKLQLSQPM